MPSNEALPRRVRTTSKPKKILLALIVGIIMLGVFYIYTANARAFDWVWSGVGKDDIGSLKVHVELGSKLNRVSWRLSTPDGVEFNTIRVCRFCIEQMLHGMVVVGASAIWKFRKT